MGRTPHIRHIAQSTSVQTRLFDAYSRYGDIGVDEIEICDYDNEWTYVACDGEPCTTCSCREPHIGSIIISVDGACSGNGREDASMAAGIFLNTNSKYNRSIPLDGSSVTNQVAELRAGILALKLAMDIHRDERFGEDKEELCEVIIKADSEYLVKGMTDYIFKWMNNGYLTAKNTPVTNSELFKELERLVNKLNDRGVEILFWHVPRRFNKSADMLARMAQRQTR